MSLSLNGVVRIFLVFLILVALPISNGFNIPSVISSKKLNSICIPHQIELKPKQSTECLFRHSCLPQTSSQESPTSLRISEPSNITDSIQVDGLEEKKSEPSQERIDVVDEEGPESFITDPVPVEVNVLEKRNPEKPPDKAKDFLSGIVIALANVPSSVAFANIAGVNPLIGIWSSVTLGIVSAIYGGRPGLIAGAASAVCVPLSKVSIPLGLEYMHATVLLSAILQGSFSVMKLGSLISLVTDPALFGFLNGLGLIIAKSQLKVFTALKGASLYSSVFLSLATVTAIRIIPRFTTKLPSSLIALVAATLFSTTMNLPVQRLVDVAGKATFAGGMSILPKFKGFVPSVPYTFQTLKIIGPVAFSMALITFLQSLLASKVVENSEKICHIPKTENNRVLMGVALGNVASGITGGHGGCGLLPFTVLNTQNGGRGTLSSVTQPIALGLFVMVFAPLIGMVPLPALAGLMFTVAWSTIKLEPSLKITKTAFSKQGTWNEKVDFMALAVGSLICYQIDMAIGILVSIGIAQLAQKIHSKTTKLTLQFRLW